ncbi:MAG: thiol-disulfide oxidoreductase DCC family protein [Paludibacter sp.]|nr:thiol-disulfide oxidoreductase DCC family protein [Paludibacter sp.]
MSSTSLILFDGVCNFCCGWVQFLIRVDKKERFKFAALQSDAAKRTLTAHGLVSESPETVIYLRGNRYFYASTAVLEILHDIGGVWKIVLIFKLIPRFIRDAGYRFFASRRYKLFGKKTSCMLSTPENEKRFLL